MLNRTEVNGEFKNKRILVTGGAGFIGSNLVDELIKKGAEVTVLDNLFTGRLENINQINKIQFVRGSVTNHSLLDSLIKTNEIVFHLAVRNIIVCTKEPRLDFKTNTLGTFNILLAAKNHGIERIIFASSASVYGNSGYLPINENDRINALNPYAASKAAGENYCFAFYTAYNIPMVILRYSNVYGINQSPQNPYCGVVSKFFDNLIKNKPPQIHGDGVQTRDFTYVDDVVEATLLAALKPKAVGEIFNIGTGKETSVNELVHNIIKLTNKKIRPDYIDRRDIDNIRRRVLNIEKSHEKLGWVPTTSLINGLRETYAWLYSSQLTARRQSNPS